MLEDFIRFARKLYPQQDFIPLHAPYFAGNESAYVQATLDSTFVSSVGEYVDKFEQAIAKYTGAKHAIATVNGTAALHIALKLAGVQTGDEVITQSLTFIATCNAISYCNAQPVFVDVSADTLGLDVHSLADFLAEHAEVRDDGVCWNKHSQRPIRACVPMHSLGFPVKLAGLKALCEQYHIALVEDAAESLGSYYHGQHTGTQGLLAAISFNGNKIITTGGGGMILTNDEQLAKQAKHITTTAKVPHRWRFEHDQIGYNYRMPNLNAALGLAQLEALPGYVDNKRATAKAYQDWGKQQGLHFIAEQPESRANYWLNALLLDDAQTQENWLEQSNAAGVMTRPLWIPMHQLDLYQQAQHTPMPITEDLAQRLINVPSSVRHD